MNFEEKLWIARKEGCAEARDEATRNLMKNLNFIREKAMEALGLRSVDIKARPSEDII